ncbi:NAD-dependent epimerase/dehydratase family protein [Kineococcus endophyticus]|uniref:NAD-dependent epimerase/dehydratase family protein n=1 Tax=Kineococcus endophyticus TaxID=1181883 RepID=A0ABV3P2J6_9ACTN
MDRVLVTGGTGFVASHLVARLLQDGHHVSVTVRDPGGRRTAALRNLTVGRPGHLAVHAADLLTEGSFDAAAEGVDTVFHVASPFFMAEQITDPQTELVDPALLGTRNVLGTVNRTPSVRRVVLTSTIGAMFGDYSDTLALPGRVLTEDVVNTSSSLQRSPYHYSKVLAENEAWRIADEQDRWSMVSVNPGLVLGPVLVPGSASGSLFLLDELMAGKLWFGVPDIAFAAVDVRDVADAHVAAGERTDAAGRYIVSHREMVPFTEMARILRSVHDHPWRVPRTRLPTPAVRLLGPAFGLDRQFIEHHVGIRFTLDNRRSRTELGVSYRPVADSLRDHYRAWSRNRAVRG